MWDYVDKRFKFVSHVNLWTKFKSIRYIRKEQNFVKFCSYTIESCHLWHIFPEFLLYFEKYITLFRASLRGLLALLQERFEHWSKVKIQSRSLEFYYQNFLKLVNSMKANLLFVGLNPNTNVQEKTPEFHVWCFKNKEQQKYLNVETRLFSPALIKFLATRLVPLLVFTKRSCVLFLIRSVSWLLVAVYFIYRNWPSLYWL